MNSLEYWRRREEEAREKYIKDEEEYTHQVQKIYQNQLNDIQTQINAFYGKYAKAEGITIAEAKKRVSQHDVKAFEQKAAKYVKDKDFSPRANEELRLYNATMKINRLEMLKANIGLEMIAGHDELEKFMGGILKGRTEEELKRQAGILGKTIKNNAQLVNSVVNASFHNATFSDRIWLHQDLLRNELSGLLQSGMIQGKSPDALARELIKKFNVKTSDAERLMVTELRRVQTEAAKQSYERNGNDMYTFLALNPEVNSVICDECRKLDGQHFKVSDMKPGENAPPMHPRCHCGTAPYHDRAEYEAWLDWLDSGKTTAEWNDHGKAEWDKAFAKAENGGIIKSILTNKDRKAILGYMSAKSYNINEKLRYGDILSAEDQSFVDELDYALEKMPVYKGDLSRSIYFYSDTDIAEFVKAYTVGGQITYNEYISTTKGKLYNPDGQVQIIILDSKRGKDISLFNEREQEVIYQRGAVFNVKDIELTKGVYYITLEEA